MTTPHRMNAIAVIPARGGSKRIAGKNIHDFMGKPLLAWTIEAAQRSNLFSRIVVSTDSPDIAAVARAWGVDVPFLRSSEAADDVTPVSVATIAAAGQAREYWNEAYESVVQLMPTCPLRKSEDIIDAYEHFTDRGGGFQLSCVKFGWMNPWWAFKVTADGTPEYLHEAALRQRSQDLPDLFCPSGAVWIASFERLIKERTFYGPGHHFHPLNWTSAVDIDTQEDLTFARAVYLSRMPIETRR